MPAAPASGGPVWQTPQAAQGVPGAPGVPGTPPGPFPPQGGAPFQGGAPGQGLSLADGDLPPQNLWQKMRADPEYAPEHLALEAVARLGPQANAWAQRTRAQYPGIHPDQLSQMAIKRFTTHARISGAAAGATGLPGGVIDIGVLAWTQARMVLHIAAAYGIDPAHPDRATDLLVLQKVHKVAQTARTALQVAKGHEKAGALLGSSGHKPLRNVLARLTWKLAQMAGVRAAKRLFAKVIPGAAIILGTWANSSATKDLARRSVALYRR
ncbi:EcsC family protein [Virgisporangium aliadipatigenens]|uniref:EcsC family protein n=1 Tax=Virgisporangium aliadipatigenens TaxID=741659 RepID=UPI0027E53F57|nr:EcsC family protein [Virgisporangium aliadipatigenens]